MSENSAQQYLVRDPQGNVYGPADIATLREWVRQGRIVAGMHIAPKETAEWIEVSAHAGLADLLAPSPIQPASAVATSQATPTAQAATYPVTPVADRGKIATGGPGITSTAPLPVNSDPLNYTSDSPKLNVPGLLSMIVGIVALLGMLPSCLCFCIGGPINGVIALAALVLGGLALVQIRNEPLRYTGRGMAIAGLACGGLAFLFELAGVIFTIITMLRH